MTAHLLYNDPNTPPSVGELAEVKRPNSQLEPPYINIGLGLVAMAPFRAQLAVEQQRAPHAGMTTASLDRVGIHSHNGSTMCELHGKCQGAKGVAQSLDLRV